MAGLKKPKKKDTTNPSTVLIIFLVFFVLLSIGLGVWGYYGYAGQTKLAEDTKSLGKFAYAEAVDRVANLCGIRSSQYTLSSGQVVTTGKKESQQARVGLVGVSIVQGARFLSTIQSMWVNLNCERLKLTRKPGVPDQWDLDMTFRYDY